LVPGLLTTVVTGNVEDMFHGIQKLKERQVKLYINESVCPVAQTPRRTPFHLRNKVAEETQQLVDRRYD
jgi:hypothetical protein